MEYDKIPEKRFVKRALEDSKGRNISLYLDKIDNGELPTKEYVDNAIKEAISGALEGDY